MTHETRRSTESRASTHPLEMLTGDEVKRAVEILRDSGRLPDGALFASIVLHEPDKDVLAQWKPGDPVERRVRAVIVPGPECGVVEAIVDVGAGVIEEWDELVRRAADAADARGRAGDRHDPRQPRVPRRARAARHHRRHDRPRADRPVAGGRVRLRVRGRPPHLALHLVPARRPDRQRLRAPDRRPDRALRHRPQRGDRGRSTTASRRCRRTGRATSPQISRACAPT